MNTGEALKAARAAGVNIKVEGDELVLEAPAPPPSAVLNALSFHKFSILALLRSVMVGGSAEHWRRLFEERTRVFQHNELRRDLAEAKALEACTGPLLNKNPGPSPDNVCMLFRAGDRQKD